MISYLAARPSIDVITAQRQFSSLQWWELERRSFRLVISQAVYDECLRGTPEQARQRLAYLEEATVLPLDRRILEVAERLLVPGAVPSQAATDAIHIGAAAVYGCDYLLTWNFRHIANVRIRQAAERILRSHGYQAPIICTPDELTGTANAME